MTSRLGSTIVVGKMITAQITMSTIVLCHLSILLVWLNLFIIASLGSLVHLSHEINNNSIIMITIIYQ